MSDGADVDLTPDRCETECLHPEVVRPLLKSVMTRGDAEAAADLFAVLADASRARLLHALTLAKELCVCDLALLAGISESATSHQLRALRDRRVVSARKVGRIVYYRLSDPHMRRVLSQGMRHAREEHRGARREIAS